MTRAAGRRPARLRLGAALGVAAVAVATVPATPGNPAGAPVPVATTGGVEVSKAAAVSYQPARYSESDPRRSDFVVSYTGVPADARATIEWAVGQFERMLVSPVPVRVAVRWEDIPSAGRGGSPFLLVDGQLVPFALVDAQRGADADASRVDLSLTLDSNGTPWHTPVDGDVPRDRVDLASVVLHELLHGLGFVGFGTVDGHGHGSFGPYPALFDVRLRDGGGRVLTGVADGGSLAASFRSGDVSFEGPQARAARSGARPELYAPGTWSPGSSLYHLDEATHGPGTDGSVMTPLISTGEAVHDVGGTVLGMLADLGWTVVPTGSGPGGWQRVDARSTELACPSGVVPEDGFADLPASSVHEAAVDCVVWWQVARGRTATTYAPEAGVTREQMASFLLRVLERSARAGELPTDPAPRFPDVSTGSPHARSVDVLAALGIVAGRADGTYRPGAPVTRAQMATFLVRTVEFAQGAALPDGGDPFGDDDGDAHETAIGRAAAAGISGGTGTPGAYAPSVAVRRDQMGSFLARTLDVLVTAQAAQRPS